MEVFTDSTGQLELISLPTYVEIKRPLLNETGTCIRR